MSIHDIVSVLLVGIGFSLSVLVHELGHAILQKMFGLPVSMIEWGSGPRIFKFKVFEMRLIPLRGSVFPNGSTLAKSKWVALVIAAGGILAQWFGMWMIAVSHIYIIPTINIICISYAVAAFVSLLNLIPTRNSDGYFIIKALRRTRGMMNEK